MKTIRMSDFEANMLQSLNLLHGSVINELKIGRLIASVFEHKDIKKKFPYDFSGQGKLIAIMAIHLYMKKEGKVRIIHNDNKENVQFTYALNWKAEMEKPIISTKMGWAREPI